MYIHIVCIFIAFSPVHHKEGRTACSLRHFPFLYIFVDSEGWGRRREEPAAATDYGCPFPSWAECQRLCASANEI